MNILMLGVKEYPYGISAEFEKFPGGGTARYIITLSEKLIKNGNTVKLIVRRMPGQKRFESFENLYIYRVRWINNKYLRLPSFSILSFIKALSIIKNIDIIHSHGSFDAITGVLLGKIFKKKVCGTPHGLTSHQAKNKYSKLSVWLTRLIEKWGFSRLDRIIYLNNYEKKQVENILNICPENFSIINMGIEPINVTRVKSRKFKVLFIGRLVPAKGLDKLILSFQFIPQQFHSGIEYTLVGDGFYRKKLENLVKKLGLESNIKFAGFTNNISQYLADASLFILPSEGGEGLPVSLLESMSAGVPCIVSNFKISDDNSSVIALRDNNPKILAETITDLYLDKNRLGQLSNAVKQDFNKFYAIDKVVLKYIDIYKKTINCQAN
jgi:glycosyltransferase involved in cell wall biosynthesis